MKRGLGIALLALAASASAAPAPTPFAAPSVRPPAHGLAPPAALAAVPVYLAVDLQAHQILAERNADRVFLPASMTKVMTVFVAFGLMAKGKVSPDLHLVVSPQTAATWSARGTGMRLKAGEQMPVDILLHGITTVSANDASVVLAEGLAGNVANWTALMNAEARKLGMTRSHFATPNGWPDGGATHVSAADMVRLGSALVERYPALYRRYFGKKTLTWNGITQQNHDPTVGVVPGADGIKTGHTRESGYSFLGTAVRDDRRVMIVIGGATSEAQRAQAARDLLEWSFSAWDSRALIPKGAAVGEALVQAGDMRRVRLVAPIGVAVAIPHGANPQVTTTLRYRGPLVAPIAKGAEVAWLEIAVAGQPVGRVPLAAAESVAKAGPFDRLANGVAGLLP